MIENQNGKQDEPENENVEQREEVTPMQLISRVTLATARLAGRAGASDLCEELHHYAEQLEELTEKLDPKPKRSKKE